MAYGWGAVSTEPMDYRDYAIARQNLVEHKIGTRLREQKAREDALARKNAENVARQERQIGPRRDR